MWRACMSGYAARSQGAMSAWAERVQGLRGAPRGDAWVARTLLAVIAASRRRRYPCAIKSPPRQFTEITTLAVVSQCTVRSRTGPVISHARDIMPRAATSRTGMTSWAGRDLTSGVRSQNPYNIALGHVVKTSGCEIKGL